MWIDDDYGEQPTKVREVLRAAKHTNRKHTVPKRIDSKTVIWITPEQSADPKFMKRFNKQWEQR